MIPVKPTAPAPTPIHNNWRTLHALFHQADAAIVSAAVFTAFSRSRETFARAPPFVPGPFVVAGEENRFIRDERTGFVWMQQPLDSKDWLGALDVCKKSRQGGYGDFRLPNMNELATLLNRDTKATNGCIHPISLRCRIRQRVMDIHTIDDGGKLYDAIERRSSKPT